jgi:hypothetical protein
MRKLQLTPRKLAFVVGTRAALAAGIGLLASGKLSMPLRRRLGATLVAFGALTTIPAIRTLANAAR